MARKRNINGENEREKTRENSKKLFAKFYEKKQREREIPVIGQKGEGESSDYQRQVVVRDRIANHRASTYRRT